MNNLTKLRFQKNEAFLFCQSLTIRDIINTDQNCSIVF